ncbi:DMT family transporter [Arthrobacter bambusae]|uniref:Drug/metabolite transporter (DMT)-like permease n=1 Tax=Arthrobacter bambusae TaxID=1338426 RepID=A0AAW8DGR5_9MICC|nr:DMT family transporter [Arthrobacter bambusae]MDP9904862.1 drug/metabolite transporter (DMT)-like permease [Arthrobacter bambusae]MDQ0129678.1 drug/metabolite transporter (DMT)-like permease [Arthrobacter bambusae]MDQ0180709.1 drug/metabolite transporter (DMT)-like permease [Arthrobacter bambusae]
MATSTPISPATTPSRTISKLGIAAVIVTVVLWASAFVGIRAVGPSFSPGSLTLGRLVVAAVALGIVALPRLKRWPKGREWLPILAYGVMWFAGYNLALNAAEHMLDAGTSAMLINVSPILIAVLAGVILKEGFPRWLIIGSLVAFGGVALIALGSGQRSTADVAGVLLCLLAAVLAAVSVIVQKPVLRTFSAAQATWFGIMVGAVCCLPWAGQLVAEVQAAPLPATLGLVYLGIFPTAIAFTTWAYALSLIEAGKLAATTYLVPGTTILISWAVLKEIPTIWGLVGGVICLVGVGLTRRRSRGISPR